LSKKNHLCRLFVLNSYTRFRTRSDSENDHEGDADTNVKQMRVLSTTNTPPRAPRRRAKCALFPVSISMELSRYRAGRSRRGAVLSWVTFYLLYLGNLLESAVFPTGANA